MTQQDRENALSVLRASQDRTYEREGIPMVLALVSEVGEVPAATDPAVVGEGRRLAAELSDYRSALVPSSRDDDLGCLISVLQAVSYADFAGVPVSGVPAPPALPADTLQPADVEVRSDRVGR